MECCVLVSLVLCLTIVSLPQISSAARERRLQKRSIEVADQLRLEHELRRVKRLQEDAELSRVKRFNEAELSRQKRRLNDASLVRVKRIDAGDRELTRVKRLRRSLASVMDTKLTNEIALRRMKRDPFVEMNVPYRRKRYARNRNHNSNSHPNLHRKRDHKEMAMKQRNFGKHRVNKKGGPQNRNNARRMLHGQHRWNRQHKRYHKKPIKRVLQRHFEARHRNSKTKRHL